MSGPLDMLPLAPGGVALGKAMIERASWAARAFASYDVERVREIARAAAEAGAAQAQELAAEAVEETGFGVIDHKVLKNIACSRGIYDTYAAADHVSLRMDSELRQVVLPRPAGVIFALTPSTNPVATAYFNIMLALLTRNTIVVSPHPFAKRATAKAARIMAEAAVAAGAPDGCIQVVAEPSVPLVNALMTDDRVDVIVATGGTPMVRAAYSSANPALGVGPGNVPVLVDATADLARTAKLIVDSKSFDNSVLCTNESVLVAVDSIADRLTTELQRAGSYLTTPEESARLADLIFDGERLNTAWIGRSAETIAEAAGIKVPRGTRVLITPIDLVVPEEPMAHEKLMPVLAMVRVPTVDRGIAAAQAVLRITGAGHSAVVHSQDAATIAKYAAAVRVLRVAVNVGSSLGNSGFETHLAPTMTIGTGFFGRSSLGANLAPEHLVHETRIAYPVDLGVPMPDFAQLQPWSAPAGPVPAYPTASNLDPARDHSAAARGEVFPADMGETDALREEIRRLVIEELRAMVKS